MATTATVTGDDWRRSEKLSWMIEQAAPRGAPKGIFGAGQKKWIAKTHWKLNYEVMKHAATVYASGEPFERGPARISGSDFR